MGKSKAKKKKALAQPHASGDAPLSANGLSIGATMASLSTQKVSISLKRQRDQGELGVQDESSKLRKVQQSYPSLTFAGITKLTASIKIGDLQQLVLYCFADAPGPQWVAIRNPKAIKKALLLHVPGLDKDVFRIIKPGSQGEEDGFTKVSSNASPDEYLPSPLVSQNLPEILEPLSKPFQHVWPVRASGDSKHGKVYSPLHSMLTVSLPKMQESKLNDNNGTVLQQENSSDQPTFITDYLASKEELQENDYPVHPALNGQISSDCKNRQDWVHSSATEIPKTSTQAVGWEMQDLVADYQILAVDCEMCQTAVSNMELTRVSLVDWSGNTVMDELVKPATPITDYLTPYSGITPLMLESVDTTLQDIQARLLELLTPKTILVGHSLESDLKSLRLTHPLIIDTSLLFPHPRGPPLKSSLKWLAQKWLGRHIQKGHGVNGHDSVEDALACLDLVKGKCTKGPLWGATQAEKEPIFKRIVRANPADPIDISTCGVIVDSEEHVGAYGAMGVRVIAKQGDNEVVDAVNTAVKGDKETPPGGFRISHATIRSKDTGQIVSAIDKVHSSLPPFTLFVVYSGIGDLTELRRLQSMKRAHQQEFKTTKWDELSIKWTDIEEQAMRRAADEARKGISFMCIK